MRGVKARLNGVPRAGNVRPVPRPRLLHLHSTFAAGGKEARAASLMNAWGGDFEHVVVSGVPDALGAAKLVDPGIAMTLQPVGFPPLSGRGLGHLRGLATAMRGFDLVLTYNWGAVDAVMAKRLFGGPPLVHHEDGFNADENAGQKPVRVLWRRLALPAAHRLVVPSRNLERIATGIWRQPAERVHYIPNGIDAAAFLIPPAPDAIPGFTRAPGEVVIGTLAGLRPVKNLPRLVRAFAAATQTAATPARLVIVGEGPEAGAIRVEAEREGVADRLVMPGFLKDPRRYAGLFDIFALSSDSEQFPISLVETMAAGLPAAATAVGDVAEIVAAENRPFLAPPGDEAAFARALAALIDDPKLRRGVGEANRARVTAEFTRDRMNETYRALYEDAM